MFGLVAYTEGLIQCSGYYYTEDSIYFFVTDLKNVAMRINRFMFLNHTIIIVGPIIN